MGEVEKIIILEKFKTYKPYRAIEQNIQDYQMQQTRKSDLKIKNMMRRAYRNGAIFYIRGYEKMLMGVIENEKIKNVKICR